MFGACQPMGLSIKLATGIFCISVKFHYFSNQQQCCKIHDIHVGYFGINDVLMFEAGFVLQLCNFNHVIGNIIHIISSNLCKYKYNFVFSFNLTLKQIGN